MSRHDNTKVNISSVIALMVTAFSVGVVYMWSALKGATEQYFSWSSASANMVSSIMLFAFTGGCFLGGMISDKIGPKRTSVFGTVMFGAGVFLSSTLPGNAPIFMFYVTYSIVAGAGSGFVFTSSLSTMPKWFPSKAGLGTGLSAAAFALSTVVFSPVAGVLLTRFDITVTLKILSAVTFVPAIIACMFIKLPGEEFAEAHPYKEPGTVQVRVNMNLNEAMKIKSFWVLFACLFFYNGAWNMLTPLIKGLGVERGLSESMAILCLSLTGAANALGRLCMSALSDRIGRYKTMYLLCLITGASSTALAMVTGNVYFGAVLGLAFAYGGPAAVFPALCTDLFGSRYSGRNYGFMMLGLGLSSIVFNTVSNAFYAATGSYMTTFTLGMVTALMTIFLIHIIRVRVIKIKNVRFAANVSA